MTSNATLGQIREWFDTPLGSKVMQVEQAVIDQLLPGFFGYHLLQLSIQQRALHNASPIQQKVEMGLAPGDPLPFIGQPNQLPFESDSMDVVLLHHMQDFYESPQQMLREVARVSIPMGHVVIVGFNPISLWGAFKPIGKMRGTVPWVGNFIRPGRLMDWLNLLNFKIDRAHYSTYGLPTERGAYPRGTPDFSQGLSRNSNLPFGAVYVIVARKHVGTMTPIRPSWRSQRAFGQLSVVQGGHASRNVPPEATE